MNQNKILIIEKTLFEMGQVLSQNQNLQKLLVLDKNDMSESFTPLTFQQLLDQEYISLAPRIESGLKNKDRNTFLVIHLNDMNLSTDETRASGYIFVGTDYAHVILKNNKNRLLQLINEVTNSLDGIKLSAAGEIGITYASAVTYSESHFGYRISFNFNNQISIRKAEL